MVTLITDCGFAAVMVLCVLNQLLLNSSFSAIFFLSGSSMRVYDSNTSSCCGDKIAVQGHAKDEHLMSYFTRVQVQGRGDGPKASTSWASEAARVTAELGCATLWVCFAYMPKP